MEKRTAAAALAVKTTGGLFAAEWFPKGQEMLRIFICSCGTRADRLWFIPRRHCILQADP